MSSTSTTKKILFFGAIIVCLVLINNLARSIYDLWHKQDLVASAQKNLQHEKEENQRLKAQYAFVKTDEFIEREARNKLFLVKPGEKGVILPKISPTPAPHSTVNLPNWQRWLELFTGK